MLVEFKISISSLQKGKVFSSSSSPKWKEILNYISKEEEKLSKLRDKCLKILLSFTSCKREGGEEREIEREEEEEKGNVLFSLEDGENVLEIVKEILLFGDSLTRFLFFLSFFTIFFEFLILFLSSYFSHSLSSPSL